MNTRSIVSTQFSGCMCNNVLQAYRAFWFAYIHGIPFKNVILGAGTPYIVHAMFDNIRSHFVADSELYKHKFDITYNCWPATRNIRKLLTELDVSTGKNVTFCHSSFIYPELPWEYALFCALFSNDTLKRQIATRYAGILWGNTVGYTIRRGDTVPQDWTATLSVDYIINDLRGIINKYRGLVRILVATDDIPFVRTVVDGQQDIRKHVYLITESEDVTLYLLSLCDYVVCNGEMQTRCCWYDDKDSVNKTMFSSTFGQVAQVLSKAYKYSEFITARMLPLRTEAPDNARMLSLDSVDKEVALLTDEMHRHADRQDPYPAMLSMKHIVNPPKTGFGDITPAMDKAAIFKRLDDAIAPKEKHL